jgi:APA family basic amino acid/polyamine antiporter
MAQRYSLARRLGLASATMIVVSNMIGTGVFTTTGFLAGDLGRPGLILLSWVIGAICALLGAICYSELAVNFPMSGGEYVYLNQAYGATWGFISGWVSLIAGFSAPIAAAAVAFASYVTFFLPVAWRGHRLVLAAFRLTPEQMIALAVIAVFSIWNLFGIGRIARVQNTLTIVKLALIGGFVFAGLLFGHGDWHNFSRTAVRWTGPPLWQQFAVSLFWVYVAYSGCSRIRCGRGQSARKNPAQSIGHRHGCCSGGLHSFERSVSLCSTARVDERHHSRRSPFRLSPFWLPNGGDV